MWRISVDTDEWNSRLLHWKSYSFGQKYPFSKWGTTMGYRYFAQVKFAFSKSDTRISSRNRRTNDRMVFSSWFSSREKCHLFPFLPLSRFSSLLSTLLSLLSTFHLVKQLRARTLLNIKRESTMLPLSFTLSSLFPDFLKLVLEIARHLVVSRTRIISRFCYIPEKLVFSWFFSLQFGRFGIIIEKNMFLINIRFLFPHSRLTKARIV